jgi:hypothetical protein
MRRCVLVIALLTLLAAPAAADAKRLVRYDVGGGLAGRSATLTVDRSGSARQSGTRSATQRFMVPAKQLGALKRELKAARFSSLKRRYQPDYPVLDGITQVVTYKGARGLGLQRRQGPQAAPARAQPPFAADAGLASDVVGNHRQEALGLPRR